MASKSERMVKYRDERDKLAALLREALVLVDEMRMSDVMIAGGDYRLGDRIRAALADLKE